MTATRLVESVYRVPRGAIQKLDRFRREPATMLTNKLRSVLGEERYLNIEYGFPVYHLRRLFLNHEGRRAYAEERAGMPLNALQQRMLRDLKARGIAIVRFSELFPNRSLAELQAWAEALVQRPENREQIRRIEGGYRPDNPLGLVLKFYLVRLLGDKPAFDLNSPFVDLVFSDEILRTVCAYFESFVRIADMDFWCNIPTNEPDTFSQTWHRDSEDRKLVKMFLWLRDVDETAGPFHYLPGSHSEGPYSDFYPQTRVTSRYPPAGEVEKHFSGQTETITGEAGTLILCDTAGIHKGGHPTHKARLLFTALFSTNTGWDYGDRFSIPGLDRNKLNPAARYAAGRIRS